MKNDTLKSKKKDSPKIVEDDLKRSFGVSSWILTILPLAFSFYLSYKIFLIFGNVIVPSSGQQAESVVEVSKPSAAILTLSKEYGLAVSQLNAGNFKEALGHFKNISPYSESRPIVTYLTAYCEKRAGSATTAKNLYVHYLGIEKLSKYRYSAFVEVAPILITDQDYTLLESLLTPLTATGRELSDQDLRAAFLYHAANAYNSIGLKELKLGEKNLQIASLDRAEKYFLSAASLTKEKGYFSTNLVASKLVRAKIYLDSGNPSGARICLDSASQLLNELDGLDFLQTKVTELRTEVARLRNLLADRFERSMKLRDRMRLRP